MKVKTIILRVLAIALSLAALISLAGGAYTLHTELAGETISNNTVSFGDWCEGLNGDGAAILGEAEGTWKASEAFFIISIILLSVLVIAIVLQFFINKNWLQKVVRIVSIVSMIMVLLAFVLLLAGGLQFVNVDGGDFINAQSVCLPAVGAWLFLVFGLIGTGIGIACGGKLAKAKRSKRK